MDNLISTKSNTASPVDGMMDEIHLLNVFGDDGGTDPGPLPETPGIKELSIDRGKLKPIPEIEKRLDAFFDEDEALADFSFGDDGDSVVPYGIGEEPPGEPEEPAAEAEFVEGGDDSGPDGIVPFHFDDEFQQQAIDVVHDIPEASGPGNDELQALKSGIKSLDTHKAEEALGAVDDASATLGDAWSDWPEGLVCLEMIDSMTCFARCCEDENASDIADLLGFICEQLELQMDPSALSRELETHWLTNVFSRYVAFHHDRYRSLAIARKETAPDTDDFISPEDFPTGEASSETELADNLEDPGVPDMGKQAKRKSGFWSLFGFGKNRSGGQS